MRIGSKNIPPVVLPISLFVIAAIILIPQYKTILNLFAGEKEGISISEEVATTPESSLSTPESYSTPEATETPSTKTATPTAKPKTPTASPSASPLATGCSYDLNGASGAVKIIISPSTNYLDSSLYGELKANSGCKVLVGKTTDTQYQTGDTSQKEVIFNGVPGGQYSVRVKVKETWLEVKTVTVSAATLSSVTYTIPGDPSPTPTTTPTATPITTPLPTPTAN